MALLLLSLQLFFCMQNGLQYVLQKTTLVTVEKVSVTVEKRFKE